jgi:predicted porin
VASFSNTVIGDTVWNNAIQYVTPPGGDFSLTAIYAPGEVAGDSAVSNYGLHLRYNNGPLQAVLSGQRFRTGAVAPSTGEYAYLAGFSYDFGPAKLYGSAQATDNAVTDVKSRTWQSGTSVRVTPTGSILFSWARTGIDNPKAVVGAHNTAGPGLRLLPVAPHPTSTPPTCTITSTAAGLATATRSASATCSKALG